MSYHMTQAEREAFLADLHVGVLDVTAPERGPVLVPIWYVYQPGGELRFVTDKKSGKVDMLKRAGRFTVCVQNEAPPYQYVSVEGRIISMAAADHEGDLGPIARRYLGEPEGDVYVQETAGTEEILVRMQPERWSTADYGKE